MARRVAVVGGGPVGWAAAWRCAQRGHEVTVYDPRPTPAGSAGWEPQGGSTGREPRAGSTGREPQGGSTGREPRAGSAGREPQGGGPGAGSRAAVGCAGAAGAAVPRPGAWRVAAGMLAPVAEAYFGERELTALLVAAAADWPGFAAELAAAAAPDPAGGAAPDAGRVLGLRTEGTLVVGRTSDDLAEVDRLRAYQETLGLPVHALRPAQLRAREPLLAPGVRGGAYLPDDHAVDPRRLVAALRAAAAAAGVRAVDGAVTRVADLDADQVVVAAGLGLAELTGLPVRPVKGQVLRLRTPDDSPPGFRHVIRGVVDGRGVYCVPRTDGEVVVGATVEERADRLPTAGAVLDLLRAAVDLIPALAEYALAETGVGHRAGTPDNGPLLGRLDPRTVVAGGFYRHGIVCTPLAAAAVAALVDGRDPAAAWAPFAPDRFVRS